MRDRVLREGARSAVRALPLTLLLLASVGLGGCHTLFGVGSDVVSPSLLERPFWGERVETVEGFLDYLTAYPDEFSLVAYWTDAPERGIYHQPQTPRPLASTMKILVLTEYARQAEAGLLDPDERVPLDSLTTYHFPLTDAGAHRSAVRRLRREGRVEDGAVALDDVALAMIRHSSNAATDYLIARLGRGAVERAPERMAVPGADVPLPISGLFLGWDARGTPVPPEEAFAYAARLRSDAAFRRRHKALLPLMPIRLSYAEQRRNGRALPAGTAEGYADLMARIYAGTLLSDSVSARVRRVLAWPMEQAWTREHYEAFGTKGGGVAGVLTRALFARPRSDTRGGAGGHDPEAGVVLALFVENLPRGAWEQVIYGGTFSAFTNRMLTDPTFFERVRSRIAAVAPPQEPRQ
jgi:predicted small secreted protein